MEGWQDDECHRPEHSLFANRWSRPQKRCCLGVAQIHSQIELCSKYHIKKMSTARCRACKAVICLVRISIKFFQIGRFADVAPSCKLLLLAAGVGLHGDSEK